ncbi:hypothetical protein ACOMHN_006254 [Nucella lapillus]
MNFGFWESFVRNPGNCEVPYRGNTSATATGTLQRKHPGNCDWYLTEGTPRQLRLVPYRGNTPATATGTLQREHPGNCDWYLTEGTPRQLRLVPYRGNTPATATGTLQREHFS